MLTSLHARFGLVALFSLSLLLTFGFAPPVTVDEDDEEEPKYTISEVMKEAHKSGLLKKVTGGEASRGEKETLLELYQALAKNEPPKGEDKSWKEKTTAIVKAAQAVYDGDPDAEETLAKAVNCRACHTAHKP